MKIYERDFKGIFIPASIWLNTKLKPKERMVVGIIYWFTPIKELGCTLTNKDFASFLNLAPNTCSKILNDMARKGIIGIKYTNKNFEQVRVVYIKDSYK